LQQGNLALAEHHLVAADRDLAALRLDHVPRSYRARYLDSVEECGDCLVRLYEQRGQHDKAHNQRRKMAEAASQRLSR
jgi:hypothetical protein